MLEIHFALNCSSNNNARVFVTMIMYEPNNIVTIKYFKLPSLISPFCLVTKRTRSNMIFVKTPVSISMKIKALFSPRNCY